MKPWKNAPSESNSAQKADLSGLGVVVMETTIYGL